MPMQEFSLEGRVAIVTGASRGIGRAIAIGLAEQGADVALASRSEAAALPVVLEIATLGRGALAMGCDVSKAEEVITMVQQTMDRFGRIDILVNSAAISPAFKSSEEMTDEEWREIIDVNLTGTFICCREVGKIMLQQQSGSVINLSSAGGIVGLGKLAAYCASKGGVEQLTKVLALDWASRGVRVNAIAPGYIITDLTALLQKRDDLRADVLGRIPMGRLGTVREVVGAAVYLASDAANYVTGQTLCPDGGYLSQ